MTRRLLVRARAEADLAAASRWHGEKDLDLARGFLEEVRHLVDRIALNPEHFPRVRMVPDVRRALCRRFPYRVFFVARPDTVVVFAVLHASRHDRTWQNRLS